MLLFLLCACSQRPSLTPRIAKIPEGRSTLHPLLPVVNDTLLSCGEQGGVIASIDFASWGLPGLCATRSCATLL